MYVPTSGIGFSTYSHFSDPGSGSGSGLGVGTVVRDSPYMHTMIRELTKPVM